MSEDLRELFRREASEIPSAQHDARAVTAAGRRRMRWRRVTTACALVAAVTAGAGVVRLAGREAHPPAAQERLSVLARVPLSSSWSSHSRGVGDLAYGLGKVWALQGREPTLQRIDPGTNRVEEVLTLANGDNGNFWHVEAGFGRLWLTNPHRDGLLVLDPRSGDVIETVEGVPRALDLVATNEHLWVSVATRDAGIYRVDPETFEVAGPISMGAECCASGMVEHGGFLWVAHSDVADQARNPGAPHDDLVFDLTNELRKFDAETLELVDSIRLPGDTYRPGDTVLGGLVAAAGHLWVAHPDGGFVDRVDPASGTVESVDLNGVRPSALTYFRGAVWAWHINGSRVVPIDPSGLEVGPTSDLGEDVSGWPVEGGGSLWTAVQPGNSGDYLLRVGSADGPAPVETPQPPPEQTPPPRGEVVEPVSEREQAQIFVFRALAETGLMKPFSARSYNFASAEDTSRVGDAWRIGLAASDCEPRGEPGSLSFTCTGISGEDPQSGIPMNDTFLTVELSDGAWTVTGVEGNMPEDDRSRIVGYTAEQRAEPSHWEFPAAEAWPMRSGYMVEMWALWIGPYPTDARGSVCVVTLLDRAGEPVDEPIRSFEEPPNRAFETTGTARGLDLETIDGDVARVDVDCYQQGS